MKKATATATVSHEKQIVHALRQLSQKLDAHSKQLLSHYDVTMPQIICLNELSEKGSLLVSKLADAMHLTPSTMVGILDRLEKKDFVTRTRDTVDRRSVHIDITDKGRTFLIKTPHLLHNRLSENLEKLSSQDQRGLVESLGLILRLME